MNTINVVLVEPGKKAKIAEIGTEFHDLQKIVGGNIELYHPFEERVCFVCSYDSKFDGSRPNRAIYDEEGKILNIIYGNFFICDYRGKIFGSLTNEQLERYKEKFFMPENFINKGGLGGTVHVIKVKSDREER